MSKVVRIHQTGGPEVLKIEDMAVGDPGPGEVRLRIEAIGLNRSEAMYRKGGYLTPPQLPSLMGYEAAGVLEAVGAGVTGFAPGNRVGVLPNYRMGDYGTYAERAIVPAEEPRCHASGPDCHPGGIHLDAVFHRLRHRRGGSRGAG